MAAPLSMSDLFICCFRTGFMEMVEGKTSWASCREPPNHGLQSPGGFAPGKMAAMRTSRGIDGLTRCIQAWTLYSKFGFERRDEYPGRWQRCGRVERTRQITGRTHQVDQTGLSWRVGVWTDAPEHHSQLASTTFRGHWCIPNTCIPTADSRVIRE